MTKKFDKKAFKKEVEDNVRKMYRKDFADASEQEVFQAVSSVVKDMVIENWIDTQKAVKEQDPKTVLYVHGISGWSCIGK